MYLLNRPPAKSHYLTSYQVWKNKVPDLRNIKTCGFKTYAYLDKSQWRILHNKAVEGTFVGYDNRCKSYRMSDGNNEIIRARTVKFIENSNSKETEPNIDIINGINVQTRKSKGKFFWIFYKYAGT